MRSHHAPRFARRDLTRDELEFQTRQTVEAAYAADPYLTDEIIERVIGHTMFVWTNLKIAQMRTLRRALLPIVLEAGGAAAYPRPRRVIRDFRRDPSEGEGPPLHDPSASPVIMRKVGAKWEVWLDVRNAIRRVRSQKIREGLEKTFGPDAMIPVIATRSKPPYKLAPGKAAKFGKEQARGHANTIVMYGLDLGTLTYAWIEERRS